MRNLLLMPLREGIATSEANEQLRAAFAEKIEGMSAAEKFEYLKTNPLGLSQDVMTPMIRRAEIAQNLLATQIQDTSITEIVKESFPKGDMESQLIHKLKELIFADDKIRMIEEKRLMR